MDRLTYRYADGKAYVHSNVKFGFEECTERLAAYEDTGLEPNEISQAMEKAARMLIENSELRNKLRDRASQENEPLTLNELRQMESNNDGTPIWIEPTDKYQGEWTAAWYIWLWDTKDFEIDTYNEHWLAYRSKPKEEGSCSTKT